MQLFQEVEVQTIIKDLSKTIITIKIFKLLTESLLYFFLVAEQSLTLELVYSSESENEPLNEQIYK